VRTASRAAFLGRTRAAYRAAKQHHPEREFAVSRRVNPPRTSLRWSHLRSGGCDENLQSANVSCL
jgi:hypothetical protein